MADPKKEYKTMLKILEGMATPPISVTKLNDLAIDATDAQLKTSAAAIAEWLRKQGGTGKTKGQILALAKAFARDQNARDHAISKHILGVHDYCTKQIASVVPDWHAKALADGWVPDWQAVAMAAGWTRPSPPPVASS